VASPPQAWDDLGRSESEQVRDERTLIELLQELRLPTIGVQVPIGSLVSIPFAARFGRLDPNRRHLYVAVELLAAVPTAQFTASAAHHGLVSRRHRKAELLRTSNVLALTGLATPGVALTGLATPGVALTGLATPGVALTGAVLLVAGTVPRGRAVPVVVGATLATFLGLRLVLPVAGLHIGPHARVRGEPTQHSAP
jgi:hypothetical protein